MPGETRKILLDARLVAYRRGGIARYTSGLLANLPAVAPDLHVRAVANRPADTAGTPVTRVLTPPHHRLERLSLGFELTVRRPSLIHAVDFIPPRAPKAIRRIATVHDLAFLKHPELVTPESARYYGQAAKALGEADRVITVSRYTAADVSRLLGVPEERVTTIYNAVDDAFFAAATERQADRPEVIPAIPPDRPLILIVGTIEPRKRHQLLFDALTVSHPVLRDCAPLLVVVGQAGWRSRTTVAHLQAAIAADRAIWFENADDEMLRALYRSATLLAMPSLDEGFGLPAVEAMASGVPVIASSRGALPEVLGDAALLIEDDNPDGWADVIAGILTDRALRERLRERGYRRAETYRWSRTASDTARVYREVLSA